MKKPNEPQKFTHIRIKYLVGRYDGTNTSRIDFKTHLMQNSHPGSGMVQLYTVGFEVSPGKFIPPSAIIEVAECDIRGYDREFHESAKELKERSEHYAHHPTKRDN